MKMASIRRSQSPYHKHLFLLFTKPPRKLSFKISLLRLTLFFLLGFLLGITPSNRSYDIQDTRVSFETTIINPDIFPKPLILSKIDSPQVEAVFRKELIVVTPTYNRAMQGYYLSRLGQVLRLVRPPLLWIVVEMGVESMETAEILRRTGVMYRHLVCGRNGTDVKDRGVHQRNRALEHIERHRLDGVVYFADDDNVYELELFESLRNVR